jgi:hypothetical protein
MKALQNSYPNPRAAPVTMQTYSVAQRFLRDKENGGAKLFLPLRTKVVFSDSLHVVLEEELGIYI